jgi:iron(III) transport system permease protein
MAARADGATYGRLARFAWSGALLAILAFLVVYPLAMLLLGALTNTNPVVDGFGVFDISLDNFLTVLANENVHAALANSLIACAGGTVVAVAIGLTFSWIVVRTNTPWKGVIASGAMIPLFVPPLVAAVAWGILGSPRTGLLNTMFKWMGLDFRIDLYSMTGLILVFGMYYAPYVYMFTASALKNMDPSLEEAAEISGASAVRTLFTITFPLIAPAIVSGMLLSFVVMLGIYGIPAVLGAPANIHVLTTYIFKLTAWSPPLYSTAAAVAIILMAVTGALVWLQQKVLSGRSYITVAGKAFRPRALNLGPWRWLTLALALLYIAIVVLLPMLALIVAAFRKFLFIRDVASLFDLSQYDLRHFDSVLHNPYTMRSIVNTMEVGLVTALVGGVLAFAIGYTVHRTQAPARRSIDLVSTLPVAIPGLVVGVAYLWAWIGLPGGLYGTIWILALAFVARFMPDTVKALSTSFLQIHKELEEAAWICGKGLLGTIAAIVLPLAKPGVLAAMSLLFVLAIRELGSSLFLYSSDTIVMAVLLLDYYEGGNTGKTAAFSLIQIVLLAVLIGAANWLSSGAKGPEIGRAGDGAVRPARADRGGQEGRQAGALHGERRRGGAGDHQGLQQALPRDQGRDGAGPGRPAHHARQDRGRRRQADRRRDRPFRPRPDAGARRPVPGLRAAERRRLPGIGAGLAEALAAHHARLVHRLQFGAGEEPAQELDGPDQARIQGQADRPGDRAVRRHHVDARDVRAPGAGRGLLGEAGGDGARALSLERASLRRPGARRGRRRADPLQRDLSEDAGRRAHRLRVPARGRADDAVRRRHSEDRPEPERGEALPELVPVGGGAEVPGRRPRAFLGDEEAARLSEGLRSGQGQGMAARLRAVREAAGALAGGVEQGLQLPAVIVSS